LLRSHTGTVQPFGSITVCVCVCVYVCVCVRDILEGQSFSTPE
jgi:hypothetical protein